jgi:ABC-type proline/glycine betaine transport system substrate-binding protein
MEYMTNKIFGFKAQMDVGDKGESDFKKFYEKLKPVKSEDRAIDFVLKSGKTVELKTDSYAMDATANMFFETISSKDSGKLGGVFRAEQDNIDFFVYYYSTDKTFYWFEVKRLAKAVTKLIESGRFKVKSIRNCGWTTEGYALPREELKDVLMKVEKFS